VESKECTCCGAVKSVEDFYAEPRRRGGRRSECKRCSNGSYTPHCTECGEPTRRAGLCGFCAEEGSGGPLIAPFEPPAPPGTHENRLRLAVQRAGEARPDYGGGVKGAETRKARGARPGYVTAAGF
jgi:hypothetical protein